MNQFLRAAPALALLLLLGGEALGQIPSPESGWGPVDNVFGHSGKDLPGGVHRYGWPRTDLAVRDGTVAIEPALALGSWAAFLSTGSGDEVMTMGDLVLLDSEVNPVVGALQSKGIEVTAIHNHLIGEAPRLLYVHFHGQGEALLLARALRAALDKTKTPLPVATAKAAVIAAADEKIFEGIRRILGHNGTMAGRVLQIGVARAEPIQDHGMAIPPAMGMAIALNFQMAGGKVASTGDFVLRADEVNPVIRELQRHGIEVTALHSHMLREQPRLFFLHFWGVGSPEKIADGLKGALARVATRP
jgi:hypothetical protein